MSKDYKEFAAKCGTFAALHLNSTGRILLENLKGDLLDSRSIKLFNLTERDVAIFKAGVGIGYAAPSAKKSRHGQEGE